jgi:outer membrane protein
MPAVKIKNVRGGIGVFRWTLARATIVAVSSLASVAGAARAADLVQEGGTSEVRVRAVSVIPEIDSTITPIGGRVAASTSFVPEIDATYFFTPDWAIEVIAGATRHRVQARDTAIGNVDLGSIWLLPATVTGQYHMKADPNLDLYIGAGLNYTFFVSPGLPAGGPAQSIAYKNNAGGVFQAGFDTAITDRIVANLDVKQFILSTTATVNGIVKAKVDLNPVAVGVGIGYRF